MEVQIATILLASSEFLAIMLQNISHIEVISIFSKDSQRRSEILDHISQIKDQQTFKFHSFHIDEK